MSKPLSTAQLVPITFETRVSLVHEEIQRRKAETNPDNPSHYVARLWVSWLTKNVLNAEVAL